MGGSVAVNFSLGVTNSAIGSRVVVSFFSNETSSSGIGSNVVLFFLVANSSWIGSNVFLFFLEANSSWIGSKVFLFSSWMGSKVVAAFVTGEAKSSPSSGMEGRVLFKIVPVNVPVGLTAEKEVRAEAVEKTASRADNFITRGGLLKPEGLENLYFPMWLIGNGTMDTSTCA